MRGVCGEQETVCAEEIQLYLLPDEFFLQTLVWNHPDFRAALYSEKDEYEGCMRLIDWKRGNPYVWTIADKEELEQSNRLFARKFDMKHEDIIRWIKASYGALS